MTRGTDKAPSVATLALVPGLEAGAPPLRLERLAGGTVNDSWRVDTARGRFVLRIDGPAWRCPGVERGREQRLHDAAAAAGFAPRVLRRAATRGAQVSEYLDGRCWSAADMGQPAALARLGSRLAELHALGPVAGVARFDPEGCARQYLQLVDPANGTHRSATAVVAGIADAARRVERGSRGEGIVHGDLVHANLLEGAALWLLDWEYAQIADPLYDVACLLAYYPEARSLAPQLLAASGLGGADLQLRLGAAIQVYEGLTWLWQRARDQPVAGGG